MITVLIVDDDKLVRKGLISVMPWEQFDMQVVGEAGNGEKAIEFLEMRKVDLLITDLAMPVMSGIELIRVVCKRFPNVQIAVLTMHQDFEYIQEALRLGAIDYIAKVQLEKEQFEEVLARIHNRIMIAGGKKQDNIITIATVKQDSIYALLSLSDKTQSESGVTSELMNGWSTLLPDGILLWSTDLAITQALSYASADEAPPLPATVSPNEWKLLKLSNVHGITEQELLQRLTGYRKHGLFYHCDGSESIPIVKTFDELKFHYIESDDKGIDIAKDQLHSLQWIYDEQSYVQLLNNLKELQLPVPKLMQLLYGFTIDWNRLFKAIMPVDEHLPSSLICWRDIQEWVRNFRLSALELMGNLQLSNDVSGSIMTAIRLIHDEFTLPLFAIDVAKRVNLSRSYFNLCFKKVTGFSFNEYLRKVRIDKAKEYLIKTSKPVVWIAEHTGYVDDKYFSRVFREQTGLLPTEYRQQYRLG